MTRLTAVVCTLILPACGGSAAVLPPPAPPLTGVVEGDAEASRPAESRGPSLSTDMLPAYTRSGTLKAEAALLQRPTTASAILKTLAAGETVRILGDLDNSDGRWLSIAVGDSQGWVRAAQVLQ